MAVIAEVTIIVETAVQKIAVAVEMESGNTDRDRIGDGHNDKHSNNHNGAIFSAGPPGR